MSNVSLTILELAAPYKELYGERNARLFVHFIWSNFQHS